jgi:glycolate oxidase FAD binding subunit
MLQTGAFKKMRLQPSTISDLQEALQAASARSIKISEVNLQALNHLGGHSPEDLTATVEGGMLLSEFQQSLQQHRQWLPLDPPRPEKLTINELLSHNWSGPRRLGFGTVREHLIGIRVVLADGRLIRSGGQVVKNVAGYDLAKLFVGSRGTIGIIVEATFKLLPLPESEAFVELQFDILEKADEVIGKIFESPMSPTALDLHNLPAATQGPGYFLVVGFSGTEEEVRDQVSLLEEMHPGRICGLEHQNRFWTGDPLLCQKISVLPSDLIRTLAGFPETTFVARAGNGIIYYRGEAVPEKSDLPVALMRRVKEEYDPKHILPELTL